MGEGDDIVWVAADGITWGTARKVAAGEPSPFHRGADETPADRARGVLGPPSRRVSFDPTDETVIERVADAAREVVLDGLREQHPEAGDEGVSEEGMDYDALARAVLAALAETDAP